MTDRDAGLDGALRGFSCFVHQYKEHVHDVYAIGDASMPPVLVMHELPGLTASAFNFARRLREERFTVYVPHLFGTLLKADARGNYRKLCVSEEFGRLAAGVSALAFRFRADRVCVAEKIERLRDEFGASLEAHEYDSPWWESVWPPPPHAVLTQEYDDAKNAGPDHPTRRAFATLVTFLNQRLRPGQS